ncbi:MAG: DUF5615 family PIN-like protein [Chloroflexota bacterium]
MLALNLDADVHPMLAQLLRDRGFDAIAAQEVGMKDASDPEQLAYAADHSRVLLTFNIRDFAPLNARWWEENRAHPGILISPQYSRAALGELLRLVENVLQLATEEDFTNRIRHINEFDV